MIETTTTAWDLYRAGYTALVSVIPPEVKAEPDKDGRMPELGKVPGSWDGNRGLWHKDKGWEDLRPQPQHLEKWTRDGSNIGLQAREFPALDIDVDNPELAAMIDELAARTFGASPVRLSREPRRLRVFGTATPFRRMRLYFIDPKAPELAEGEKRKPQLLEFLGDGQQYLVAGKHPAGPTYRWEGPALHTFDPLDLPIVSPEKIEAFYAAVSALADDFFGLQTRTEGGGRSLDDWDVDQQALLAPSLEDLERVVACIPNTNEHFASRESFIRVGYAIRAAGGEAALDIFQAWCAKWEGNESGTNDPADVEHEWHKMLPPYRLGWEWLRSQAQKLGSYDGATDDFSGLVPLPPGGIPGIGSTPPAAPAAGTSAPAGDYTDDDLGEKLVKKYGHRLRFCDKLGGWRVYSGGVWREDQTLEHEKLAKAICRDAVPGVLMSSLPGATKAKVINRLGSASQLKALLASARADLALPQDAFDCDPLLLNTPDGVVELATGALREHRQDEYHARQTAVSPAAGTPCRWLDFLRWALDGDEELLEWVQMRAGYWLTGNAEAQDLTFLWGGGGNGKGVFANTIQHVMGTYAMSTPPTTFANTRQEAHPEAIARLAGARLVIASEVPQDMVWSEAKIKQATGGDVMTARFMNKGSFDFAVTFKLLFLGNQKPRITNMGRAMRRRIKLMAMTREPETVNLRLAEELKSEAPQILAWMIEGYAKLTDKGHTVPAAVARSTKEYMDEEDVVGRFLEECCDTADANAMTSSADLWTEWSVWTRNNGELPRTMTWLSTQLRQREGLEQVKALPMTRLRGFRGVKLLNPRDEFQPSPAAATA